jgi:hypothetical protein
MKGLAAGAGASVIVNGRKQDTVDKVVAALGAEVPGGKAARRATGLAFRLWLPLPPAGAFTDHNRVALE